MRSTSLFLVALAFLPAYPTQAQGIAAVWDVRDDMAKLAAGVHKLEPILKQLKPTEWVAKGASGTYIKQVQSSEANMQALFAATDRLAKDPERLSAAIKTYFLMERMELILNSVKEGIRRYGNSETADQLNFVLTENSIQREKLKQHVQDLTATREQELKLMDQEAQRCRESISKERIRKND